MSSSHKGQRKTALQIMSSDLIDFFFVEFDGEGPRSKFGREDNQTDSERNGKCECLWRRGATSPSCKVMCAIRNVPDQPESVRTWPSIVNLLRLVEFKTIPQPRILDAWHQWCNTGYVVNQEFLAIFVRLFDRVLVRILTSDVHHRTLRKKPTRSEIMILECSFPLTLCL